MGRERTWNRKHLFIYIACAVITFSLFSSCTRIPVRVMEEFNFRKADALMSDGQYAAALAENKKVLASGPAVLKDQALYRIAMIYVHNADNLRDVYNAREYFTEILNKYPDSSLRDRAKLWIQLIDKIEKSQREIADLNEEKAALNADNAILDENNKNLGDDNINFRTENDNLKVKVEEREKEINLLNDKIIELESKIENLKQIDLGLEQKKSKGVP
jgi:tetratricopeptide (TPR) repeat protein